MRCAGCNANLGSPPFQNGPCICQCGFVTVNEKGEGYHADEADRHSPGELAEAFTKSYLKWMLAGFPRRPLEEQDRIKKICKGCNHYGPERDVCLKCGCRLGGRAIFSKIAWATESCPIQKWEAS